MNKARTVYEGSWENDLYSGQGTRAFGGGSYYVGIHHILFIPLLISALA